MKYKMKYKKDKESMLKSLKKSSWKINGVAGDMVLLEKITKKK